MTRSTASTVRIDVHNLPGSQTLSSEQLAATCGGGAATALAFRSLSIARSYDRQTSYYLGTSYRLALLRRFYISRLYGI